MTFDAEQHSTTASTRARSNSFGGSGSVRDISGNVGVVKKPEGLRKRDENSSVGSSIGMSKKGSSNSLNKSLIDVYHKREKYSSIDDDPINDDMLVVVPREDEKKEADDSNETKWDSKFQYLLALLGWAVGLGNIWRFPYLCFKHGGGAFLVPYLIMLVFEAFPLFFMELLLGQRHRVGSVALWKKFEYRATGIGCSSAIVCVLISLYYNVILSWSLYYAGQSFQSELPWSKCPLNEDGTEIAECVETSSTEYFYYRSTLNFAGWGDDDSSLVVWPLLLCNIVIWFVVFIACVKGIASAGKAMYVTVIFPIVVLMIFFFRSVTLAGAARGISYLFKPKVAKIFDYNAWKDAATQTFFNLGLAYGTVIAYSSFNPIKNNCQQDAFFVATINAIVSVIASVTVFGIIGFKAMQSSQRCLTGLVPTLDVDDLSSLGFDQNVTTFDFFDQVQNNITAVEQRLYGQTVECAMATKLDDFKGGPGLAFIAFTEAISQMAVSQLWSFLFFAMLLMVGISSQIGILLGFLLPIHDSFLKDRITQSKFTGLTCMAMAAIGIIFCLRCGLNWVDIFDGYSGTLPLLCIALAEVLVAAWVYGTDAMEEDIEFCCGFKSKIQPFWNICWKYISPMFLAVIIVFSVVDLFAKDMKVSYWDTATSNVTNAVIGSTTKAAPLFAKFMVVLILTVPLSWMPGFFVFFTRKGKTGRRTAKNKKDSNESQPFVETKLDANDNNN